MEKRKRLVLARKISNEEFILRAQQLYGDKYSYSKTCYKNQGTTVIITCRVHGEFSAWPNNFLRGHGCPACSGRVRITPKEFFERSQKVHKGRYDYSKADYKHRDDPVCIICPVHGEFWQKPGYHMAGNGCPKCYGTPKSSTDEFITKAKEVYGNLYDYSKVVYTGNKNKVCIKCPDHGEWYVTPNNFLRGSRCPSCFGTPKLTNEGFIVKAQAIHGTKYDYSLVDYVSNKINVKIICPIHGEFSQSPASHLKGSGCPSCSGVARITYDSFVERARRNHKIEYDYSKVSFTKATEKVSIICPIHGEYKQSVQYHMYGGNCPKCVGGVRITAEDFIQKSNAVHNNKYDYSKVKYKNTSTKVCIICPEHGEFYQTPNNHLFGAGCPTCPQSNLEGEVRRFLLNNNVKFEQEKGFSWLRYKKQLYLDFYLPEHKMAIECQGGQHFFPVDLFGGEEYYRNTIKRDYLKRQLCNEHGIDVVYFSNVCIDYPYTVIETYDELLETIRNGNRMVKVKY